jgi:hypothetical protein
LPANQIGHQAWQAVILAIGKAKLKFHIPAFDKAQCREALPKRSQ